MGFHGIGWDGFWVTRGFGRGEGVWVTYVYGDWMSGWIDG